jgi:asparagine synthase (glutamine-hydrolysing)
MCGISGRIDRTPAAALDIHSHQYRAIKARGPDGGGVEALCSNGHAVTLMHSRLSILDLSESGRQPMHDPVSGWWITYNGEIYNYRELREELRDLGWTFRSTGDTEVLLKAWAQWGVDALTRLNGMFALAVFRPGSGEMWLVRDRFGVKPLAWGWLPSGGIVFSSSVAGIAESLGTDLDPHYCARGVLYKVYETAGSGSPFKKVKTVAAGSWVRFQLSENGIKSQEAGWYDLHSAVSHVSRSIKTVSDDELLAKCWDLLRDAVKLRLRSDVPLAVSLSGGLDSSSVAAVASTHVTRLRGFTYGSPKAPASEGPEVQKFAADVGIGVTYVWPEYGAQALGDSLERTMAFQEAPFCGLSLLAQNEIYRNTREAGFKVLLGGQGGDELFAGYRKFFFVALREAVHAKKPGTAFRLLCSIGLMLAHEAGQAKMYWENLGRYRGKTTLGFELLNWRPATENLWGEANLSLSQRQIADILQWSLPTLLRYEDRNSMGYGIESRLPFMDYRLMELALALPARLKITNGYGKWALRRMTTGVVPDAIRLQRRKRGFDVTQAWVKEGIGARLRNLIFDHRHALSPHLRPGVNLDMRLSDETLSRDGNLLDEALMLAWLVQPVRPAPAPRQEAS